MYKNRDKGYEEKLQGVELRKGIYLTWRSGKEEFFFFFKHHLRERGRASQADEILSQSTWGKKQQDLFKEPEGQGLWLWPGLRGLFSPQ